VYVILEGAIDVFIPSPDTSEGKKVGVIDAGKLFGEVAFLEQ
jgi:CRP-like cAMP-binding protein